MARILVADDDDLIRGGLRMVLESLGHEVAEATNGFTCVTAQREKRFDLVIVDVVMPIQDGRQAVRIMRSEFPGLPILAVSGGGSGFTMKSPPESGLEGATAIMAKPFGFQDLLDVLLRCLTPPSPTIERDVRAC
jgi:CheY-like chemotaxis protein